MASLLKQASKGKRKAGDDAAAEDTPVLRNRQRVLLVPSRGVTSQMRHLVSDLEALMPHSKKGEYDYQIAAEGRSQLIHYNPCRLKAGLQV